MIYRLHGTIQPYAWGGHDYIPQLLRREPSNLPAAELWFGDHPQAPSQIEADGITLPFNDWLQKNLNHALTPASRARFGDRLPYLLKILDVRLPLSIQVHPDKTQAEAGYAREEAAGISQGAANRNYPDDNHKPESMIALGDFWLLHGFAPLNTIEERLASRPSLATIAHLIRARGLKESYTHIMQIPRSTVTTWLKPLLDAPAPKTPCDNPDYWLHETMRLMRIDPLHPDHGLLSFYLMNIVHMQNGEGIFQRARLPHAYLRGQNIELMAASNNVLRAGLTPKHIDIGELLRIVDANPVNPAILAPPAPHEHAPHVYPAPVDDYTLTTIRLPDGMNLPLANSEATILLNLEGRLRVTAGEDSLELRGGEAAYLTPGTPVHLDAHEGCYIVIASNRQAGQTPGPRRYHKAL